MRDSNQAPPENFAFSSSLKEDAWHPKTSAEAYEWWYFDALSDDGKDTVVIIFLDNFIFSPRYNKSARSQASGVRGQKTDIKSPKSEARCPMPDFSNSESKEQIPKSEIRNPRSTVPALAFVYYRDGKPVYRAINEFSHEQFSADENQPECRIGENSFKFESAPYGSGYSLQIKANLPRRRFIEAKLEWLLIETDLLPAENFLDSDEKHHWNLVAPRADVTGSIKVSDGKGKLLDVRHFRGTGYHDHNLDARWLPSAVQDWQWGRAHFEDCTAVYYRYRETGKDAATTKLFLIKDEKIEIFDADYREEKHRRNVFGVKFPGEITISAESVELKIRQMKPIDQSFFYLRFLSEANLKCADGKIHEAFALTEHLAPKMLKYRWLDWLVDMRIGRNGKGAFL